MLTLKATVLYVVVVVTHLLAAFAGILAAAMLVGTIVIGVGKAAMWLAGRRDGKTFVHSTKS